MFRRTLEPEMRLVQALRRIAELEHADPPGDDWVPQRWRQTPTWRCGNLHVSRTFTAGRHGGPVCKWCDSPVHLTFPGDRSGPLRDLNTTPSLPAAGSSAVPPQRSAAPMEPTSSHPAP